MLDMNGENRQRDFALLNTASYTIIFFFYHLYIFIHFTYSIMVLSSYIHSKALLIIVKFTHTMMDEMLLNIPHLSLLVPVLD